VITVLIIGAFVSGLSCGVIAMLIDDHSQRSAIANKDDFIIVLDERRRWLAERIKAKKIVGWSIEWDQREHDALVQALDRLQST
jgi:hypothetical protein